MNCRPYGSKPTLALWMLVGIADGALVLGSAGALTTLLLALAVAVVAGAVITVYLLHRHGTRRKAAVTQGRRSWQLARAQTESLGWR
jgi:Flp pilus assembly protein TadB